MDTVKVSIGVCSYSQVQLETAMCMIYALNSLVDPYYYQLNFHKGTYVHQLRNNMLDAARENGADYLMFIDADVTFPPDAIMKLLGRKKDIIGGMYNLKSLPPINTIKMVDEKGKMLNLKGAEIPIDKPFKCFAVPTGFMLIRLEAIKDMKRPFQFEERENDFIGEDVFFCKTANEMGLEVWCDPTITIGHIGEYLY